MSRLQNGQNFPHLEIPAVGGGTINLPEDFAKSYGVILIYRGHWCPFCNEQMDAFAKAFAAIDAAEIKVVAFSVDDEAATADFIAKHNIPFRMGHSAKVDEITAATGAYQNQAPEHGRFLESTGFVLAPDGTVIAAVYSSLAIGHLVPNDVVRLVTFIKSLKKPS